MDALSFLSKFSNAIDCELLCWCECDRLTYPTEEDDDEHDNLEPISTDNIITSGRRTRGKTIDFAEAAEKAKSEGDEMDDDDDDEDFAAPDDADDDDDHHMRD